MGIDAARKIKSVSDWFRSRITFDAVRDGSNSGEICETLDTGRNKISMDAVRKGHAATIGQYSGYELEKRGLRAAKELVLAIDALQKDGRVDSMNKAKALAKQLFMDDSFLGQVAGYRAEASFQPAQGGTRERIDIRIFALDASGGVLALSTIECKVSTAATWSVDTTPSLTQPEHGRAERQFFHEAIEDQEIMPSTKRTVVFILVPTDGTRVADFGRLNSPPGHDGFRMWVSKQDAATQAAIKSDFSWPYGPHYLIEGLLIDYCRLRAETDATWSIPSTRTSMFDANGELVLKGPKGVKEMVVLRKGFKISWNVEAMAFEVTFSYQKAGTTETYTTTRLIRAISTGATLSAFGALAKQTFQTIINKPETHSHLYRT